MSIFTTFWPQWNRAYTFSSISGVSCNPQIDNPLMLVCVYHTCSEGCSAVVGLANREELVPVLLFFLQPSLFFPDILTTAGPWYRAHEIHNVSVGYLFIHNVR